MPASISRELAVSRLSRATEVRVQRARIKRDLKAGRVALVPLLNDPEEREWIASAQLLELLCALPNYGSSKAHAVLSTCRLRPNKTVDTLTERQRNELAECLGPRHRAGLLERLSPERAHAR